MIRRARVFWGTGYAAVVFHPFQKVVQVIGRDGTQRPVGWKELRHQPHIRQERLDSVGRTSLIVQIDFPGIDGRDQGVCEVICAVLELLGVMKPPDGLFVHSSYSLVQKKPGVKRFTRFVKTLQCAF